MKAILAVALMVVGVLFSCSLQAATLEQVLANSAPVDRGTCNVSVEKYGMMLVECVKGLRTDGATIYAIVMDGEIVAVFEQVSKDVAPKQIWNKQWQET